MMGWMLLAPAVALMGYVWVQVSRVRSEEAQQERERAELRRLLARDPKNTGAYEALADSLRAAGRLPEARAAYQGALEAAGPGARDDRARYKLGQVEREMAQAAAPAGGGAAETVVCSRCGGMNPPGRRVCETCEAVLPYDRFRDALRDREVRRAGAEAASCGAVLLVVLAVFQTLPLDVKGALVMATVIVCGWRFLKAVGGSGV